MSKKKKQALWLVIVAVKASFFLIQICPVSVLKLQYFLCGQTKTKWWIEVNISGQNILFKVKPYLEI